MRIFPKNKTPGSKEEKISVWYNFKYGLSNSHALKRKMPFNVALPKSLEVTLNNFHIP